MWQLSDIFVGQAWHFWATLCDDSSWRKTLFQEPDLWGKLSQLSPTEDNFLDSPGSVSSSSEEGEVEVTDPFLSALGTPAHPVDSTQGTPSRPDTDTVDSDAFPITDIKEEPESGGSDGESLPRSGGESPPRSGGESLPRSGGESPPRSGGESPPRSGEESPVTEEPVVAPPDAANLMTKAPDGGSDHSASSGGHLNESFSASDDEELSKKAPSSDISRSNSSVSGDSPDPTVPAPDATDTLQDLETTPAPIPRDIPASTPMAHVEPEVIVVDNGSGENDSDDNGDIPAEKEDDPFHSNNNNVALDTTPVLEPTNNSNSSRSNSSSSSSNSDPEDNNNSNDDDAAEEHSTPTTETQEGHSDDVTHDEGYFTGKFLPEGETPLLPPDGSSPGIQHHVGKEKVKARKGSGKSKSEK